MKGRAVYHHKLCGNGQNEEPALCAYPAIPALGMYGMPGE